MRLTPALPRHRSNLWPGFIMGVGEVAFSPPTQDGMGFAQKYTCRPDVLVYGSECAQGRCKDQPVHTR